MQNKFWIYLVLGLKKIKTAYNKKTDEKTQILLRTKMSENSINKLRKRIFFENSFYPGKTISLKDAIIIYQKYPHILSPMEFYRNVLHIKGNDVKDLNSVDEKLLEKEYVIGEIHKKSWKSNRPLSNKEIKSIRNCLINNYSEEQIAGELYRSLEEYQKILKELVNKKVISLKECRFECVKKLYFVDKKSEAEIKAQTGFTGNEIMLIINEIKRKQKLHDKNLKKKDELEGKANVVLERFIETPKAIEKVNSYIKICMELYEQDGYPKDKLDLLEECISFCQGGTDQIKFFTYVCIKHREYDKAYRFISNNIDNESVKKEDKIHLRKLQKDLKYAEKKERAIEALIKENLSPELVSNKFGITLVEAIELKRKIKQGKRKQEFNLDDNDEGNR